MTLSRKFRKPRVADEIMAGMRELERMMDEGKSPDQLFTVRTVEVPDPHVGDGEGDVGGAIGVI